MAELIIINYAPHMIKVAPIWAELQMQKKGAKGHKHSVTFIFIRECQSSSAVHQSGQQTSQLIICERPIAIA